MEVVSSASQLQAGLSIGKVETLRLSLSHVYFHKLSFSLSRFYFHIYASLSMGNMETDLFIIIINSTMITIIIIVINIIITGIIITIIITIIMKVEPEEPTPDPDAIKMFVGQVPRSMEEVNISSYIDLRMLLK